MILGCLALLGCEQRSSNYENLMDIPPDRWETFAKSLPIDDRLDLHIEIMESRHNPPHTIESAFQGDAVETYKLIVRRILEGDENRYYIPVIYEIDRDEDFSICRMDDRKVVQEFLWRNATSAVPPDKRAEFYYC